MGKDRGLRFNNIQGGILRGYGSGLNHARFIYCSVSSGQKARATIGAWAARLTKASQSPRDMAGATTFNVAISYKGLCALGAPRWLLQRLPLDYREGMAAHATILKDTGSNAPAAWSEPWADPPTEGRVHLIVSIYARDCEEADRAAAQVVDGMAGLQCAGIKQGARLPDNREHFGFMDGFGQPEIKGLQREPGSQYEQYRTGRMRRSFFFRRRGPIEPGEFLFGYQSLAEEIPPVRPLADTAEQSFRDYARFMRDGTFMVFRELAQDVPRFKRELQRLAEETGSDAELLAAKMVGRWPDGTPLMLAPTIQARDRLAGAGRSGPANRFGFRKDPEGVRCPIGAHIRRANPRDSLHLDGRTVDRHRIIRRGIPYGPAYTGSLADEARGLVFIAFNASISGQFELIQAEWLNSGHILGVGGAADPIGGGRDGAASRTFVVPAAEGPPAVCTRLAQFVTLNGGDYFFVPGVDACESIARWTDAD